MDYWLSSSVQIVILPPLSISVSRDNTSLPERGLGIIPSGMFLTSSFAQFTLLHWMLFGHGSSRNKVMDWANNRSHSCQLTMTAVQGSKWITLIALSKDGGDVHHYRNYALETFTPTCTQYKGRIALIPQFWQIWGVIATHIWHLKVSLSSKNRSHSVNLEWLENCPLTSAN